MTDSYDSYDSVASQQDSAINQFRNAVAKAAPAELEVTALEAGFDVVYREQLTFKGVLLQIDSTFRVEVRCDSAARTFTMTDVGIVSRSSLATLSRTTSRFRGRQHAMRMVEAVGLKDDGTIGRVSTQRQDTRVLHSAVREPAVALGWTERQPKVATFGKWVAIMTGCGLVVGAVVVVVLALTGGLS
ncbi:hypothetical protein [Demequina oxidasica]|uniref:hypothetical protein n=1 Tax=Demequina oxidasica TaxID=676199 RepID=UPI000782799E|nr:hypothetical protein [Demequina oxidasica]